MKFLKRANAYKASNFYFQCDTRESWSYGWWKFSTIYKGTMIFNNVSYSMTTNKHQNKALALLDGFDIMLRHTRENLTNIEAALNDEIFLLNRENEELEKLIHKPRTRKKTNEKRSQEIIRNKSKIQEIKELLAS